MPVLLRNAAILISPDTRLLPATVIVLLPPLWVRLAGLAVTPVTCGEKGPAICTVTTIGVVIASQLLVSVSPAGMVIVLVAVPSPDMLGVAATGSVVMLSMSLVKSARLLPYGKVTSRVFPVPEIVVPVGSPVRAMFTIVAGIGFFNQ